MEFYIPFMPYYKISFTNGSLVSHYAMFPKRVVSEPDAVMEAGWKRHSRPDAPTGRHLNSPQRMPVRAVAGGALN